MSRHPDVLIVGGGIFGVTAALELVRRGARVRLLDPGPLPHPDAASTDISKLVRLDYGGDVFYTELMEEALLEWRRWNFRWPSPLFHETGILVASSVPMEPSGFEGASFALLEARGHTLERLASGAVERRFPAWAAGRCVDGYFNPQGGFAESGRVVAALFDEARQVGVEIEGGARVRPLAGEGNVTGVETEDGVRHHAHKVVIAAGAFTPVLVPELADRLTPIGQPVMHFRPTELDAFTPPQFVPWAADIGRSGWYGFSAHAGVVKIANHGPGQRVDPAAPRVVGADAEPMFRAFLRGHLPSLASAPRVAERLCLYCDTFDGDFFIGAHEARAGLVIAAGGSGHAFKFAPLLGSIIADATLGHPNPRAARFGYRALGERRTEDARSGGSSASAR